MTGSTYLLNIWNRLEDNVNFTIGSEVAQDTDPGSRDSEFRLNLDWGSWKGLKDADFSIGYDVNQPDLKVGSSWVPKGKTVKDSSGKTKTQQISGDVPNIWDYGDIDPLVPFRRVVEAGGALIVFLSPIPGMMAVTLASRARDTYRFYNPDPNVY